MTRNENIAGLNDIFCVEQEAKEHDRPVHTVIVLNFVLNASRQCPFPGKR